MIDGIVVRESLPSDIASIETLYADAFPEEDLRPLVRELLSQEPMVLSLVGHAHRALVGHVIFSACGIVGRSDRVALLGPLAVAPNAQRRGLGGALLQDGLERLKRDDVIQVYVLGDPGYYGRFGFQPETGAMPPYPLPEEYNGAWQSIRLRVDKPLPSGTLSLPPSWLRPALWAP
jgi:putative acetyltransferase